MKKEFQLALLFILGSIFLRFFSFFPAELDHDESTYMIIANEILHGKKLYTDVTDTKPVGIFLLYALLQTVFGYSIFLKRLFAALIVGLTSYLLSKVARRLFNDRSSGIAAGIIYIFYTSMWIYFGLSPNTELYFNLCTISGLLLFLRKSNWTFLLGGLMMGIGFMFKYLVLFDFAAFMLYFLLVELIREKRKIQFNLLVPYILAGFAFLTPFLLTAFYFYAKGRFADFYFISFELPGLYKDNSSPFSFWILLADLLGRFLPITVFLAFVVFKKHSLIEKSLKLFFIFWILAILVAIYLPGKAFSHYAIQLMLPFSLLAGVFFHAEFKQKGWLTKVVHGKTGILVLSSLIVLIQLFSFIENVAKPDSFRQVASYLKKNLNENETLFVSNYEPIIYYLLEQPSPTKYVHSSLLFSDLHKVFKLDQSAEVERIIDTNPKFVLVQYENKLVEEIIRKNYFLACTFRNNEILIYQRNNQ